MNQKTTKMSSYDEDEYDEIESCRNWVDFSRLWLQKEAEGKISLQMWRCRQDHFSLTETDLANWRKAIDAHPDSRDHELSTMYEVYAKKYPLTENFLKLREVDPKSYSQCLLIAHEECGHSFVNGYQIFDSLMELEDLYRNPGIESLIHLYCLRLMTPHREIRQTYEKFSKWVTEHVPNQYNTLMRDGSKMMSATEKQNWYFEQLEKAVRENPDDPSGWIKYIQKICKFAVHLVEQFKPIIDFFTVKQIFLRSLFEGTNKVGDPKWIPVWEAYIRALEISQDEPSLLSKTNEEFIRTYPYHYQAYLPYLRDLHDDWDIDLVLVMVDKVLEQKFEPILVEAAMGAVSRNSPHKFVQNALKYGKSAADNYSHELVMTIIENLENMKDEKASETAKTLAIDLFEISSGNADSWIFCFKFFVRNLPNHVKKLLTLWEEDVLEIDEPEKLIQAILRYLRFHGTWEEPSGHNDQYVGAFNKADEVRDKLKEQQKSEPQNVEGLQENSIEEEREVSELKRTKVTQKQDKGPVRSREQFRIQITPVAQGTSQADIEKFFEGYGKPVSIFVLENNKAIVEFSSEQEVLTCLTRDVKPLNGELVKVSRIFGNTVWVTNYPAEYSSQQIAAHINAFGESAFDIRFPLQSDTRSRRFCYADFSSPEVALTVRNSLNKVTIDGLRLQAEISNPTLKKDRNTPPANRQVFVKKLDFKETTEKALREFFSQFGDVEGVNLPLSDQNKAKGNVNNGFAFITFTTETAAQEALHLGGAQLHGRRIEISKVKSKQNLQQQNMALFKAESSVTIENINPKVSSGQLQAFLEQKVGPVLKVHLQPSKKAALVEFEYFSDAGKAGLLLEGLEYEDYILQVGPKDALGKIEPEAKSLETPRMVPPMLMRRRRR